MNRPHVSNEKKLRSLIIVPDPNITFFIRPTICSLIAYFQLADGTFEEVLRFKKYKIIYYQINYKIHQNFKNLPSNYQDVFITKKYGKINKITKSNLITMSALMQDREIIRNALSQKTIYWTSFRLPVCSLRRV